MLGPKASWSSYEAPIGWIFLKILNRECQTAQCWLYNSHYQQCSQARKVKCRQLHLTYQNTETEPRTYSSWRPARLNWHQILDVSESIDLFLLCQLLSDVHYHF